MKPEPAPATTSRGEAAIASETPDLIQNEPKRPAGTQPAIRFSAAPAVQHDSLARQLDAEAEADSFVPPRSSKMQPRMVHPPMPHTPEAAATAAPATAAAVSAPVVFAATPAEATRETEAHASEGLPSSQEASKPVREEGEAGAREAFVPPQPSRLRAANPTAARVLETTDAPIRPVEAAEVPLRTPDPLPRLRESSSLRDSSPVRESSPLRESLNATPRPKAANGSAASGQKLNIWLDPPKIAQPEEPAFPRHTSRPRTWQAIPVRDEVEGTTALGTEAEPRLAAMPDLAPLRQASAGTAASPEVLLREHLRRDPESAAEIYTEEARPDRRRLHLLLTVLALFIALGALGWSTIMRHRLMIQQAVMDTLQSQHRQLAATVEQKPAAPPQQPPARLHHGRGLRRGTTPESTPVAAGGTQVATAAAPTDAAPIFQPLYAELNSNAASRIPKGARTAPDAGPPASGEPAPTGTPSPNGAALPQGSAPQVGQPASGAAAPVSILGASAVSKAPASGGTGTPGSPLPVSGAVMAGYRIAGNEASFPVWARSTGVHGTVTIGATIGPDGVVRDVRILRGPLLLRESAVLAVRTWRYRPYLVNGQPVSVDTTMDVVFSLK